MERTRTCAIVNLDGTIAFAGPRWSRDTSSRRLVRGQVPACEVLRQHLCHVHEEQVGVPRVRGPLFWCGPTPNRRREGKIVPATPLLVLDVRHPFTKYVFCELERAKLNALEQRIATAHSSRDVQFVEGDCNERVNDIAALIPSYSKTYRVLTFCFVDPNRNRELYLRPESTAVSGFVGNDSWRDRLACLEDAFRRFCSRPVRHGYAEVGLRLRGPAKLTVGSTFVSRFWVRRGHGGNVDD
jgi:hypothetical protein